MRILARAVTQLRRQKPLKMHNTCLCLQIFARDEIVVVIGERWSPRTKRAGATEMALCGEAAPSAEAAARSGTMPQIKAQPYAFPYDGDLDPRSSPVPRALCLQHAGEALQRQERSAASVTRCGPDERVSGGFLQRASVF